VTCRISLAAAGMALLSLAAVSGGAAEAQTHASSHTRQHGVQFKKIRAAVIKVIGTQGDRVEAAVAGTVLTVARINSTMNQTDHGARAGEASRIVPAVATTIVGEPAFNHVHTIRVSTSIAPSRGIMGKSSMRWISGRTRPAHSCRMRPERSGIGRDRPGAER
jgi:hypothetical protein